MQLLILGLLLDGPRSLYDLHKRFLGSVSLFYAASYGSIQRTLHTLIDEGLVDVADAVGDPRGRKLHTITAAGHDAWREGMLAPVVGADAERVMLTRVHLLGHLAPDERATCLALLRERRLGLAGACRSRRSTRGRTRQRHRPLPPPHPRLRHPLPRPGAGMARRGGGVVTGVAFVAAAVVLTALAVLQVLVAAGRPYGHLVWGGQHRILPTPLRAGSAASSCLYTAFSSGCWAARAGFVPGDGGSGPRVDVGAVRLLRGRDR